MDLCLQNVNVRLIGNGGGLVYAPLGPTHEAIEDLAIMRAIPNMTIVAPADADEMRRLMPLTLEHKGPMYIRLAKGRDPIVTNDNIPFQIGKAIPMREGSDALFITTGITLGTALEAANSLQHHGLEAAVLHIPTVKPFDFATVLDWVSKIPVILSIEEHTRIGGLGSAVAELIAEAGFSPSKRFKIIGLPDEFPNTYGSQESLMARCHLTAESLSRQALEMVSKAKEPTHDTTRL